MQFYHIDELPRGWSVYPHINQGYRVNLSIYQCFISIFNKNNNEVWMIWTDIFPCILFSYIYVHWLYSDSYQAMNSFYRILASGTYVAALTSRSFSCIYHIFNPISLQMNRSLINLDYIGITSIIFGYPWVYANALHIKSCTDDRFIFYISGLALCMIATTAYFTMAILNRTKNIQQTPIIIFIVSIGTATSSLIVLDHDISTEWKFHCMLGTYCFLFGYIVFYNLHIPESLYKPYHPLLYSHVMWHNIVTMGQYLFLCTTYL